MKIYSNQRTGGEGGGEVFWGEITPCEHLVQFYEDTSVFMDALERYIAGGLRAGDGVIIIATRANLSALEERLVRQSTRDWTGEFDLEAARDRDQYITLDAEETLAKFMVNGWPDDFKFTRLVTDLVQRARGFEVGGVRRVRAFGEMVAVLWAAGDNGATVRLEHLWHSLCQRQAFCLFCAYPRIGFTQDADASLREICAAHSRVVQ